MTITTTSSSITYTGDGSNTVWNYSFLIPADSDAVITITTIATSETQVLDPSVYTITGINNPVGGSVTYPLSGSPLSTAFRISIQRILPLTQEIDLVNQDGFYPEVVENEFDYLTMLVQQLQDEISRVFIVPVGADLNIEQLLIDISNGAANATAAAASAASASSSAASATTSKNSATASAVSAAASAASAASIAASLVVGADSPIINGNFLVWQRGLSFTSPAALGRVADMWNVAYNGTAGTFTVTRKNISFLGGLIPGYPTFALNYTPTVAGVGNTFFDISQVIEDVNTFSGNTITISAWVYFQTSDNLIIKTEQYFGSGGSPSSNVFTFSSPIVIPAATWVEVSFTTPIASIAGKTLGTNADDHFGVIFSYPPNAVNDFWITAVKVIPGSVVTPYAPRPPGAELALCQRYVQKSYADIAPPGFVSFAGCVTEVLVDAAHASFSIEFPVLFRTTPFIVIYSPSTGVAGRVWNATTAADAVVSQGDPGERGVTVTVISGASTGDILRFHWFASAEF